MSKKIVLALGGNALGDDLAGQMKAVKITSQAIVALIAQDMRSSSLMATGHRWA